MSVTDKDFVKKSLVENADKLAELIVGLHRGERLLVGRSRKIGFKVTLQKIKPIVLNQIGNGGGQDDDV